MHQKLVILDFGGQYAHLIASRIRREKVLAEIWDTDTPLAKFADPSVVGIILSGGPQSVYQDASPQCDPAIFDLGIPVLGICYGHQFLNYSKGGEVIPGQDDKKEFGQATLTHQGECPLFADIPEKSVFWMSHGDEVSVLGEGFEVCGYTDVCQNAAVWNKDKNWYGIQFHPEVTHSEFGGQLLKNFLTICNAQGDWTIEHFYEQKKQELSAQIGDREVFLFVSGGVDSTVAFAFLSKVIGAQKVKGIFVDNGLLRQGEKEFVEKALREIGTQLTVLEETEHFLGALEKMYDPEQKRETIGHAFLDVQKKFFAKNQISADTLLAQGTIYPDTIETGGTKNASKIKTHHNRAPEVQKLIDAGLIIEPLADLYKDEVRALGGHLGLPEELIWRHPFPGPGLGVRILCNETAEKSPTQKLSEDSSVVVLPIKSVGVQGDFRTYRHPGVVNRQNRSIEELEAYSTKMINTSDQINRMVCRLDSDQEITSVEMISADVNPERTKRLQRADAIVTQALLDMDLYGEVWQFPVVLIPVAFDGQGIESIVLRPINSVDAMSASVGRLPDKFLDTVTKKIKEDPEISAVLLDITSKPPGTIEWE